MTDPGVYELLRAMRMLLLDIAAEADKSAGLTSVTGQGMVYNETTEKFEFYKGGVLVYSLPP